MVSTLINLEDIEVSFASRTLLSKISLKISQAETLVLIGPSGEGKSTLLKVMAGLLPPHKGRVLIDGVDIYQCSHEERTRLMLRMGILFQKNALFDSLTCAENIAFPLRETTSYSENKIQQQVDFFLNEVGISHARDLFPDEISGGMQKRLGIARALALSPEIIFYDDPTAGLDPITSRKIIELIMRLQKEKNSTIVAITNEMNRAYQMADRIAMIIDSEMILTGSEKETKSHPDPRVHQFVRGHLRGPLTTSLS